MNELIELFTVFARIGAFTFGGGYAMLPILQREVVEKKHWATEDEVMDYYAIGQCTPGIIAVNTATFIGYKTKGVTGAIVATLGLIFPSIVIITIIAAFLRNFSDIPAIRHAFNGIRACVCALILDAVIKLGKKSMVDKICVGLFAIILILAVFTPLSPALIVIAAGVLGLIIKSAIRKGGAGA